MGTLDFCKAEARVKSYGSAEACLARREEAPKESKKQEFLLQDDLQCYGDPNEKCVGTENFCSGVANALSCIESHEKPPFYDPESPDCYATRQQGYFSEACRGTKDWCASETRRRIYGSAERCESFRQRVSDGPSKWVPPKHSCRDSSDGSEQCSGTEELCQFHSADRDGCWSGREAAPFLLPRPGGCPPAEQTAESCMGTDFHCHERYNETNYFSEGECFSRRGFKHDELVAKVVKQMGDKIVDVILQNGETVVKHAVYYNLVRQGGDENSALQSVKTYVDGYFDNLQEALPGATDKYMANVQKRAGA
ncbi:hypothetical protein CDD83_6148 [Cordyceps sp. RAO-2017]|nr:hypothetical protein CDD83_6148 [Cordyceps sp. RAO-2017]